MLGSKRPIRFDRGCWIVMLRISMVVMSARICARACVQLFDANAKAGRFDQCLGRHKLGARILQDHSVRVNDSRIGAIIRRSMGWAVGAKAKRRGHPHQVGIELDLQCILHPSRENLLATDVGRVRSVRAFLGIAGRVFGKLGRGVWARKCCLLTDSTIFSRSTSAKVGLQDKRRPKERSAKRGGYLYAGHVYPF